MLLHSFAMGTATVFFETAASALFLARFGSSLLPWVYVAAAAVNTSSGLLYAAIQERVRFARLMLGTLAFLLAGTLALRLGLWATGAAWLVFGLFVFYRVLSALTDLEYWAVATRLYDVRQAKRLFGMIGSGEVVARIAGSFSVPLLVGALGVANLLLVSAAGVAACLALAIVILGGTAPMQGRRERAPKAPDAGLGERLRLLTTPYLRLLLAVTFCAILAKYLVDFAFLEQMKARYGGAAELATFFGLFSGVTQVLSLATRVFVSGPVLSRFGVRAGLLVLPLAHVLCTGLLVLEGSSGGSLAAIFWLVIANQAVYKVLRHPIDNPSFKVLYQPLHPEQRLGAQIAVETLVTPVTTGLAGAVMLLFTVVIPYHPVRFACAMLVTFTLWLVVARRAGRAYLVALAEALKGRIVDEDLDLEDERSLAVLEQTLRSGSPAEVVFALDLLEKAEHPRLGALLVGLLSHAAPDVRSAVLARIERLRPAGALAPVKARAASDDSVLVRAAALSCLCALGGEAVSQELARFLEDPEPQLRRAALIALLRQEKEVGSSFASAYLRSLVDSSRPERRALAAQVVAEVGRSGFAEPLRQLLRDEVPWVRRAALVATARVHERSLWPLVAGSLGFPALAGPAARALLAVGEGALPVLDAAWERSPPSVRVRIARILGRIGGQAARGRLWKALDANDERVRHEALHALRQCGYRTPGGAGPEIETRIREEAADAAWELACLGDLGSDAGVRLVAGALDRELEANRQRILLLLSFLYDSTAMLRAGEHLADASREKRAYALEILDVTLSREIRDVVLPLCEDLPLAERCRRLAPHFPQQQQGHQARLREVLARSRGRLTPWTRACALYTIGSLRLTALAPDVVRLDADPDPLVRETRAWALARLDGPAGEADRRKSMLAIEKVITLKSVSMFARASDEVLADIAAILEEVEVAAGAVIFEKGEVGDSMYIVVEGGVRVFDGEHTITQLGESEIFGELALLDPEPRVASIAALGPTRLFRLDREAFSELMAGNIEIVRGVLSVLCERLRKAAY